MMETNSYHIKLEGDNYSVGQTLGNMAKNIPGMVNVLVLPGPSFSQEEERKVFKLFDRFCPGINEEIAGFSDVLKVPVNRVLYYSLSYLKPGCSQMVLLPMKTENNHTILARNYDFSEKLDDMTLSTTRIKGRHAHISSTSVMFGRCDGLNQCGLAVSMTSAGLPVSNMKNAVRKPVIEGLSFWAVVRSVLENCTSVEETINFTREIPIAFNLNLLVADKNNNASLIETYDGRYAVKTIGVDTDEKVLFSTNHVNLSELSCFEERKLKNSLVRYELINKTLSNKEKLSQDDIIKLLSTKYPKGLCYHFYDEFFGTLRSAIFDVTLGEVKLCFGAPDINDWYKFSFDNEVEWDVYPVRIEKETFGKELFETIKVV